MEVGVQNSISKWSSKGASNINTYSLWFCFRTILKHLIRDSNCGITQSPSKKSALNFQKFQLKPPRHSLCFEINLGFTALSKLPRKNITKFCPDGDDFNFSRVLQCLFVKNTIFFLQPPQGINKNPCYTGQCFIPLANQASNRPCATSDMVNPSHTTLRDNNDNSKDAKFAMNEEKPI